MPLNKKIFFSVVFSENSDRKTGKLVDKFPVSSSK
jgi:hypothetical protein